jgi:hypothetical protein
LPFCLSLTLITFRRPTPKTAPRPQSHWRHDSEFCERLVNTLRTAGLDVWLDDQNLGAGHLPRIIEADLI